jgi:pSer/pThr/pTyr-binding forkhead associated (FHA) protein
MNPGDVGRGQGAARRQATVLESVEEIRALIRSLPATDSPATIPAKTSAAPEQDTTSYRPSLRPSMALLHVLDDGDDSGEILRIRANSFVIGRVEGNITIPHDGGISGRHAEISRRHENGEHHWFLKDLQSTNGTFVRAATVILSQDQEVLIGGGRFRFEVPAAPAESAPMLDSAANATRKWESLSGSTTVSGLQPILVDVSPGRPGRRFALREQEYWIGRDPSQSSIVVDDPMVDRRHARVYRDEKNRWIIANARSRNGLWARIQEVGLGRGGFFQCGEQRFFFKVL